MLIAMLLMGNQFFEAVDFFVAVVLPDGWSRWYALGVLLLSLAHQPLTLGLVYGDKGEFQRALTCFLKADSLAPDDWLTLSAMSRTCSTNECFSQPVTIILTGSSRSI